MEHADNLAAAIVETACELHARDGLVHLELLRAPRISSRLAHVDSQQQVEMLCRLAIALARYALSVWEEQYPYVREPVTAIEAAEAWAACPCARHAQAALVAEEGANREAQRVWRTPASPAAWAARTAAWAAAAPSYGWQAIPALVGACRATSVGDVVRTAQTLLTPLCVERTR